MSPVGLFRIGQRLEGTFTGAIREIVGIDSYNVEYELRYRDGRVTRISGSKRSLREQIADGDLTEVPNDDELEAAADLASMGDEEQPTVNAEDLSVYNEGSEDYEDEDEG